MLTINGRRYAKNAREIADSVLSDGGPIVGYYKINNRRKSYGGTIVLSNLLDEPFAAVVYHDRYKGIVNASRDSQGRMFYQQGLSDKNAETLGVDKVRYADRSEYAETIWKSTA